MKSLVLLGAAASLFACTARPPTARPPIAAVAAGPCAEAGAWQDELPSLPSGALLRVDATYIRDTCSGTAQVAATSVTLRGSEAVASERLRRLLECPQAEIVVRDAPDSLLPAGRVEIEVTPDAGNFTVTLRADSVAKNVQLLRRVKALATPRGGSGS